MVISSRSRGLLRATASVLIGFGAIAAFAIMAMTFSSKAFGFDFHTFRLAAEDVLHNRSPYPPPVRPRLIHEDQFVYPPLVALVIAPFTLVSFHVAAIIFWALSMISLAASLLLLGVRDWRCYAIVTLWAPVQVGIEYGTLNALLVLGIAIAWRWRDRWIAIALPLALVVTAKLFLAPLILWPVLARRTRAAGGMALLTALALALPWWAISWRGLSEYRALLNVLASFQQPKSFTPAALVAALGGSSLMAHAATVAVLAAIAAMVFVAWRRSDEGAILCLAIAAALMLSPIVWMHYFTLLIIPAAIRGGRLHAGWLTPLLLWAALDVNGVGQSGGAWWRIVIAIAVVITTCALPLLAPLRQRAALTTTGGAWDELRHRRESARVVTPRTERSAAG